MLLKCSKRSFDYFLRQWRFVEVSIARATVDETATVDRVGVGDWGERWVVRGTGGGRGG